MLYSLRWASIPWQNSSVGVSNHIGSFFKINFSRYRHYSIVTATTRCSNHALRHKGCNSQLQLPFFSINLNRIGRKQSGAQPPSIVKIKTRQQLSFAIYNIAFASLAHHICLNNPHHSGSEPHDHTPVCVVQIIRPKGNSQNLARLGGSAKFSIVLSGSLKSGVFSNSFAVNTGLFSNHIPVLCFKKTQVTNRPFQFQNSFLFCHNVLNLN